MNTPSMLEIHAYMAIGTYIAKCHDPLDVYDIPSSRYPLINIVIVFALRVKSLLLLFIYRFAYMAAY